MRADDLDFHLPPELIAQVPPRDRTASRLLHYRRDSRAIEHRVFADLPSLLRAGDLLVFNDTRVVPARFYLRKESGGLVEGLFVRQEAQGRWRVMLKNLGGAAGKRLTFERDASLHATVVEKHDGGEYVIEVHSTEPALVVMGRLGRMPLPPYIRREKLADAHDAEDLERYQTVYAKEAGAVAAPTAGLHFTPELLAELEGRGVGRAFVTLHVGLGTFKPVTVDALAAHAMHSEEYEITREAAEALNSAKRENRRIIAVGTTSARVLESQPADRSFEAKRGATDIFIYPPYQWRHLAGLVTNFHLPRSTLIALVAALVGLDEQRRSYAEAIARGYRFFSYGDAMFVE
ncbi:MAG TPA: tRNA preQ1(34) S-adenosylmethionine ribosyltransferase-isomerase QueA [Tepidisphaeraceae bacterium]|nr:tRNA preQ1(34) S-adenosylmethionine ribosyltransferase-isomerase QueA [Tepidisphaeraceae bacterium]